EKLEAARWAHFLKPGGLALVNNHANPPLSVSLGTHRYPNDNEVREILKQRTDKIYLVEGTASAKEMGDVRTLNLFMLGCISNFMSIKPNVWQKCIAERLPAKILQLNLKAFEQGRKETSHVNL
ncbi:MAG: hypothetical protein FJ024_07615, partial [Chloroflexi bacterium]|nr:hypothetical protein [Chloroflexota bacterium]